MAQAQGSNTSNGILVSGLTILFVYLKLTHQIDWSWWWVLSPCWIVVALCFAAVMTGVIWAWIASDHETKMAEHRASFGARTEADAKIIAGLREESAKYKAGEGIEQKRRMDVEDERNALRAEVAELKTQLERLTSWAAKNQAARETLQTEIKNLKSQSTAPKYNVGDKLESYNRSLGLAIPVTVVGVRTVYDCQADGAEYPVGHSESELKERYSQTPKHPGEPCNPPEATHDTPEGKAVAVAAVKTEPVADEIKVGDVVEVFQRTINPWTLDDDVGCRGRVTSFNGAFLVRFEDEHGNSNTVAIADVRKVTT